MQTTEREKKKKTEIDVLNPFAATLWVCGTFQTDFRHHHCVWVVGGGCTRSKKKEKNVDKCVSLTKVRLSDKKSTTVAAFFFSLCFLSVLYISIRKHWRSQWVKILNLCVTKYYYVMCTVVVMFFTHTYKQQWSTKNCYVSLHEKKNTV